MPETKLSLKLTLPDEVLSAYETRAKARGTTVEKEISERLTKCVLHTAGRSLYFTDEQRVKLEKITGGHLIDNADTAIARISTLVDVQVGEVSVTLDNSILQRVASRARAERKTLGAVLERETLKGVRIYAGLQPA